MFSIDHVVLAASDLDEAGEWLHRDGDHPVTGLGQMPREQPVMRGPGRGPR
jgi:hypothetical protein